MASFKRTGLGLQPFGSSDPYKLIREAQYWKNFEFPVTVKEYSSIDFIDTSPVEPFYIAVTTGPKVDIYHQQSAQIWRSLTRFQRGAYGGIFRNDGKLLATGSEEAQVKLFNFRLKQLLRVFKGHVGPVHRVCFIQGKPQLGSFSDDKTVCLWDIPEEKLVCELEEHTDFIRAGIASPASEHIVLSGSYDHTVKMWDTRTGSSVLTFDHGSPVSSLLCYASGSVFASAGGTEVKIWDAIAGKLMSIVSQHHKTITCLSLASHNNQLLSGSLDGHLKVYDLSTYSTVHSMDYPAPVLCLSVAPNDSTIVTGMLSKGSNPMMSGTGLLSFEHKKNNDDKAISVGKALDSHTKIAAEYVVRPGDEVVTHIEREKLAVYDMMLCKFQFSKALDQVMQPSIAIKTPNITVAVLRELIRRRGLVSALACKDAKSLTPIFRFLIKNIRNSAYHRILVEVMNTLLDIYGDDVGENNRLLRQMQRLNEEIEVDLLITKAGIDLMGVLEMFLVVSSRSEVLQTDLLLGGTEKISSSARPSKSITASSEARKHEVVVDIG